MDTSHILKDTHDDTAILSWVLIMPIDAIDLFSELRRIITMSSSVNNTTYNLSSYNFSFSNSKPSSESSSSTKRKKTH